MLPKSDFSNFSFYPEFSVYVLQSEKKLWLFYVFRPFS